MIGLVTTTFVAYALGPAAAWIASSRWLILAVSFVHILAMMFLTALGLRLGKWLSNAGSIATLITLAILIATPLLHRWQGTLAEYHPPRLTMPPLTVFSLRVFTKMMFGALGGFEYVAILESAAIRRAILPARCSSPRLSSRSSIFSLPVRYWHSSRPRPWTWSAQSHRCCA